MWVLLLLFVCHCDAKGLCDSSNRWHAALCVCSQGHCFPGNLPCRAGPLCGANASSGAWGSFGEAAPPTRTGIITALVPSNNDTTVGTGKRFEQSFSQLRQLLQSLRAVNTRHPIVTLTLADGGHAQPFEETLRDLGALTVRVKEYAVPAWAKQYHSASFVKLSVLEFHMFDKLIFLDNDCVLTRNIDHLAWHPAPAFVYHRQDAGLNSGVMVLEPNPPAAERMRATFNTLLSKHRPSRSKGGGSDQDVWAAFWRAELGYVYELPVAYNFRPWWTGMKMTERCQVYVSHGGSLDRRRCPRQDGRVNATRGWYKDGLSARGLTQFQPHNR